MTWCSDRLYAALGALAIVCTAAAFAPALAVVAAAGAAAIAAWMVWDIVTAPNAADLEIVREIDSTLTLRKPVELRYRIRNRSNAALVLAIAEHPESHVDLPRTPLIARVPAVSETVAAATLVPIRRGEAAFERIYVRWRRTGGALTRSRVVAAPARARIYPNLSAVERYGSLHARNRLIEAGLRRLRRRGSGTQTESVRDWEPGDAFRSVDWKATARRARVMVREYETERNQHVTILIDAGRLMSAPVGDGLRKIDCAVTAALSLATIAGLSNDRVGVVAFAGTILRAFAPRGGGRGLTDAVARAIYDVEPRLEESDYQAAFAYLRYRASKRGLVVLLTDLIDPSAQRDVAAGIGALAAHNVVVCALMNDATIADALEAPVVDSSGAYRAAAAVELRAERDAAIRALRARGVHVLDVPAAQLSVALIDEYLRAKQRQLV